MQKLILVVVSNTAVLEPLSDALLERNFSITRVGSIGGFLHRTSITLMIGAAEARLPYALRTIHEMCQSFSTPDAHAAAVFIVDALKFAQL